MPGRTAPPPTAYRRAVLRLARRDQTAAELRRALAEKGHPAEEIEAAIERLRREKYLDDRGYAERFARSRMAHQGLGRARIRQGLRQRGVAGAEVEAGLRAALADVDEPAVLDGLARRYWRQHARVEPSRRLPRLWAFLVRRGFPPALVRDRLAALWPRWSDALEGNDPQDAPPEGHAGERD
ncbi:MAG: regulatory protein RecX [Vicinamibacteria bacterium]